MKKAKKARRDPYLALLAYRNTPAQALVSSPVMRLRADEHGYRYPLCQCFWNQWSIRTIPKDLEKQRETGKPVQQKSQRLGRTQEW